jgi:hypothetical protein
MALPSLNEEKPASFYPFDTSLGMKGKGGKGKKDNSEVGSDTARYGGREGREEAREVGGGREWWSRGEIDVGLKEGPNFACFHPTYPFLPPSLPPSFPF